MNWPIKGHFIEHLYLDQFNMIKSSIVMNYCSNQTGAYQHVYQECLSIPVL